MDKSNTERELQDIPKKIFEKFIDELTAKDVETNVVDQLRNVLLKQESITEENLRNALFTSDTTL